MTGQPMRKSDVLLLAGDPGGASALLPVIKGWHGRKMILAYRQAVDLFQREGLVFERLNDARASTIDAGLWLEKKRPGLVCAATSVNGVDWERHFFVASRKLGIPSVAVLDYWSNYVPRFTLAQSLDALPDVIGIMDERARIEMIGNGFPAERLSITGQPVLDDVRRWHADLSGDSRRRFREQLGLAADTRAFLFISQPLREMRLATGNDGRSCDDEFASLKKLARRGRPRPCGIEAAPDQATSPRGSGQIPAPDPESLVPGPCRRASISSLGSMPGGRLRFGDGFDAHGGSAGHGLPDRAYPAWRAIEH